MLETLRRRLGLNGTPILKQSQTPQTIPQSINPNAPEIGVTGLRYSYGQIMEEAHRRLRNRRLYFQDLREMRDNDATIGAIMFAVEMRMRSVEWTVEPASESSEDERDAEFVRECLDDMSHTWSAFISEWLWMLTYGFKPFEVVYKIRRGQNQADGRFRSAYTDGRYGWRKLAPRDPETIEEWVFDEDGGVSGYRQRDPNSFEIYEPVPISRALLFVTTHNKNNPEGRSVLRNCYVSWYYKKHLEELEAITGERDATGYPVMYAPPGLWAPGKESTLASWQSKVTAIRKDEQQGMLLPAEYDEQGNPLYKFELVKSAGSGAIDLGAVINRHRLDIASTILADWLMVGHESQGSRALSTDKTEIWADSLRGWMQGCADVFNLHGIPRLFRVNKWEREKYPTLVPGRIGKQDAEGLSLIAKNLAQAGGVILPETINAILRAADLPEQEEEDMMPEVAPPMPQLPPVVDPNQPIPQNQNGGEG